MSELITVIIPTYQHADSLPGCLDRILGGSYKNIEVIVVNDGSTDNTRDILSQYSHDDRLITVWQDNQGSNAARMTGYGLASGEYLLFCDADVVMHVNMIQVMYDTLQDFPEASYTYAGFKFGWKRFRPLEFDADRLRKHNYIHTTSLIRRKDFPGFDLDVKRLQDWDVWLTMLEQGNEGVMIPAELFEVLVDGDSRIGSAWMPSFLYKLPWNWIGWRPARLRKYEEAREAMKKKHNL
ncbi:glycosyltransferase family 2 protein [Candidatus Uhrbacteria bacterium]|jgi:glycosyltransferase involved in cell wall biosynthesis|nr:glycosyltransferase family 2 protein [Candidatus Uhrbacteria bacterium]